MRSIIIEFVDGGLGDADGVVNGIVVDPSGPVFSGESSPSLHVGSGGGGCFV